LWSLTDRDGSSMKLGPVLTKGALSEFGPIFWRAGVRIGCWMARFRYIGLSVCFIRLMCCLLLLCCV
jgi:hypothetical protein